VFEFFVERDGQCHRDRSTALGRRLIDPDSARLRLDKPARDWQTETNPSPPVIV
jgi:hypothetical protein